MAAGRVVKGVKFQELREVGDPVELGAAYSDRGADELVFLDVKATLEERDTLVGAAVGVGRAELDRVADVAQPLEAHTLDDAARGHVEARDQARERNRSLTSASTRSR